MPRPNGLDAGNDCPRRHSAICEASGEHGRRCPEAATAIVHRRPDGTIAKGSSGNAYGMRSLKSVRKYISEQTHGNQDLIDHALRLAGVKDAGDVAYPPAVQARVMGKLLDIVYGKEIRKHVEHSGTVTHEAVVRPAMPPNWSKNMTVAELEQFRALIAKATPEGAVNAEFTEAPAKGGEESEDEDR